MSKVKFADLSLEDMNAELARLDAKIAAEDDRQNHDAKKKGFTHRFNGWIHPTSGDDRQVSYYIVGEPTLADVHRFLRRSVVKTDYEVVLL